MRFAIFALIAVSVTLAEGFVTPASASQWVELRGAASDRVPKVTGLDWRSVELDEGDSDCPAFLCALLKGVFDRKDWSLVYRKTMNRIQPGPEGKFILLVPLSGVKTAFTLTAIDPGGKTESASYAIYFPDWAMVSAGRAPRADSQWTPSLGVSGVNYLETGVPKFNLMSLTGKIAYSTLISSHWVFDGDLSADLFSLSSTRSDVSVHFFSSNLRAGYQLSKPGSAWVLRAMGGLFYSQMSVSNASFGYNPLLLPELFPSLTRALPKNRFLSAYLMIVPINGFFVDNEIGAGISLKIPKGRNHSFTGSFDYTTMGYQSNTLTYISAQTWAFTIGYSF